MNNLYVFFNTSVEASGRLAWIGDRGLAPFRYLFNGKTIRIQPRDSDQEIEIHHVASFHKDGGWNWSRTNIHLKSSSTSMIKTAISVVLLIPGLFLSAFKGLAYLFADVQEKQRLAKEHLTPVNREIGSATHPIESREELAAALRAERTSDPKNRPTNALIIHGNGALTINDDPGILRFNPMKLVLEGARIVHEPSASPSGPLEEAMYHTGKWQSGTDRVNSIDEALQATASRRSLAPCKRYHMVFALARPQPV